ncbi:DNA polymerase IV [Cardiobacteriaceae bacterium TAE3-ERU3]|nr:DNA polymerase IV [Cardiobacteriaceae bacterium TAE3-ERU3]
MKQRKIIHIDMDAFFASVEQRDNPDLRGKPLIVGGDPDGRGVVAAASYEARHYGIHSAMSCYEARKRCAQAVFVRPRFVVYREVSQQIRDLMLGLTPLVEPLSLDEAYLDVTGVDTYRGSATLMAEALRAEIKAQTGLTASAGVSFNKMLAKIASDLNKPDGIAVITPDMAADFISALPIGKFHGIGKATAAKMTTLNIHNGADLRAADPDMLVREFGKRGAFYARIAHGDDPREVTPEREHKSVGCETTFATDLHHHADILRELHIQNKEAFHDLGKHKLRASCITIKIKFNDFTQLTRSKTLSRPFYTIDDTHYWLDHLLTQVTLDRPVRLVGVTFSHFEQERRLRQLALWPELG